METVSTLIYFIITIGILVLVHELGHFLAAKLFKMRVDVFSIGFPPRAFGKKFGETDYCISWIPIGGYVKIAGMIDESMDTEFLKNKPQPWEFRSKPKWQRAIVLSAGVTMNVVLAILIFWGITYYQGRAIRPETEIGYVKPNSPAAKSGLQTGDKFISINDQRIKSWNDIELTIYLESAAHDLRIEIQRGQQKKLLLIPRSSIPDISEERFGIYLPGSIPVIKSVDQGKPAEKIGLQRGDTILAVNRVPMNLELLQETIHANAGKEVFLEWARGPRKMSANITPNADGFIGVGLDVVYHQNAIIEHYSFFESLPISIKELEVNSVLFFTNIYKIIIGKASLKKSISGPVAIARMAKETADTGFTEFIGLIGLLSISLALLNILPFPALDGGHLAFLGFEAVFRREIPPKVKIIIQQVGFALLLIFMAFVIYNDIIKF